MTHENLHAQIESFGWNVIISVSQIACLFGILFMKYALLLRL